MGLSSLFRFISVLLILVVATPAWSFDSLAIGDSMLGSGVHYPLQKYLKKEYPDLHMDKLIINSSGLARPEKVDWLDVLQAKLESEKKTYNTLFIFLGTNDGQNIYFEGKYYLFARPTWDKVYSYRVKTLMNLACQSSKKVYWIGQLPMRNPEFNEKVEHINKITQTTVNQSRCGEFVDTSDFFGQDKKYAEGQFTFGPEQEMTWVRLRHHDGIHLSYKGVFAFTKELLKKIETRRKIDP